MRRTIKLILILFVALTLIFYPTKSAKESNTIKSFDYQSKYDKTLAVYIDGEFVGAFPTTNNYNANLVCTLNDVPLSGITHTISWNGTKWVATVNGIDTPGTICTVYFGLIHTFSYSATSQTYVIPETGSYKLEAWGAQGGQYSTSYPGGKGGYISGTINLTQGDILTINTGGIDGTNGGGIKDGTYPGGGATTISLNGTTLITGAGGGGSAMYASGGAGGSGTAAGGTSVGNGTGNNGTNGGGGSSSPNYTYSYLSTCGGYCASWGDNPCPSGGSRSGSTCVGSTWSGQGADYYQCSSSKTWVGTGHSAAVTCDTGYTKTYSCGANISGQSCSPVGATTSVSCTGTCNWNGNYSASCANYINEYSCYRDSTTYGNGGSGGTSTVDTTVTQLIKTDNTTTGNGYANVSRIYS